MFYKANQSYNATTNGNYTAGDTTISVTSVPSNVPTIVTLARNTTKETRFTVTGTGVGQLTGVARLDGANENIASGSAVECMNDETFINQLSAAVFDQSGAKNLIYAADGGANDDYVIALAVTPASLTVLTGLPITFKANTANTGAATLDVNSLGAKAIKKNVSADVETGDILANQLITVVYDGTNFQLISTLPVGITPSSTTTFTNKRRQFRIDSQASTDTITPEISTYDVFIRTAQAHALVINNHSTSTPVDGEMMEFVITGDATPRAITYGDKYVAKSGTALPTTTTASKCTKLLFQWRGSLNQWDMLATTQES